MRMTMTVKTNLRHPDFTSVIGETYEVDLRGYFYHNGKKVTAKNFAEIYSNRDFTNDMFSSWNGEFAAIIKLPDRTILVADKKRTIPLFYFRNENGVWVVQDFLYPKSHFEMRSDSEEEFLTTGFVAGEKTLFKNWNQVEAASSVILDETLKISQYYSFVTEKEDSTVSEWVRELKSIFEEIFDDLAERLDGKRIIIPLSGGYDSRLIALMLVERGLRDSILTFTYGRPGNGETTKSKEIADRLKLKWKYFVYNKEVWTTMYQSAEWDEYVKYSNNGVSVSHLQDFPSTKKLVESEQLKGAVFLPGHSLDYLAGGHLPYEATVDRQFEQDEVIQFILNKHHRLWTPENGFWNDSKQIIESIRQDVSQFSVYDNEHVCSIIDEWNWRERQAKFIINAVRVYEFFGQDWSMPLWDDRLIYFFSKIPVEYKYKKYLYDLTLHEMYPDYYPMPDKPGPELALRNKYGALYPVLRKAYRTKNLLTQYFKEPMEWYRIYPSYAQYLSSLRLKFDGKIYTNPYNVNSFIVKDTINELREMTK